MKYSLIKFNGKRKRRFFSIMPLNLFRVLSNNDDVRPITAELVESEILQQNTNVLIKQASSQY